MLIFWFMCAVCAGLIGASKGEGFLSFITGLVFGPFAIIFAIMSTGNKRKCPQCCTFVDPEAVICPQCKSAQPPKPKGFFARTFLDNPEDEPNPY